jgi:hypothetical protein
MYAFSARLHAHVCVATCVVVSSAGYIGNSEAHCVLKASNQACSSGRQQAQGSLARLLPASEP